MMHYAVLHWRGSYAYSPVWLKDILKGTDESLTILAQALE